MTSGTDWEAAAIKGIRKKKNNTPFLSLTRQEINPTLQISTINITHICGHLYTYFMKARHFLLSKEGKG